MTSHRALHDAAAIKYRGSRICTFNYDNHLRKPNPNPSPRQLVIHSSLQIDLTIDPPRPGTYFRLALALSAIKRALLLIFLLMLLPLSSIEWSGGDSIDMGKISSGDDRRKKLTFLRRRLLLTKSPTQIDACKSESRGWTSSVRQSGPTTHNLTRLVANVAKSMFVRGTCVGGGELMSICCVAARWSWSVHEEKLMTGGGVGRCPIGRRLLASIRW